VQEKPVRRQCPRSSSDSPDTKWRVTSEPPGAWRPYCWRYPVPSGEASGSVNRLNEVRLSCWQYCGSVVARTVCVRKHWVPLFGLEFAAELVSVALWTHPRYAVG